jgi:2-polyprenyl-3-methyl-5-hydroxy-6-metoxy-1,4-benzoquinol methylase
LAKQNLPEEQFNAESKKIVDGYVKYITDSETQARKSDEENSVFIRDLLNDKYRAWASGDKQISPAEAVGSLVFGTPEYENLSKLAKEMGPEYVDELIARNASLRDKARGAVSYAMGKGIAGVPTLVYQTASKITEPITTGPDTAYDKASELESLRKDAANGDQGAAQQLKTMEGNLRDEGLSEVIYQLPLEERTKIRRDFITKKQDERLSGLSPERRQSIIDATDKIVESYEASRFDPESSKAYGAVLPNGTIHLTAIGKKDINVAIDKLVEAGDVPVERSDYYKAYYAKLEENKARAMRGAVVETQSFKNWISKNPEYLEKLKTDEGIKGAIDEYEKSHNTFVANGIDAIRGVGSGISSYFGDTASGTKLSIIAANPLLSDDEKVDKMLDVYAETVKARAQEEPLGPFGGVGATTGQFAAQFGLPLALKLASVLGGPTVKAVEKTIQPITKGFSLASMGAIYAFQGYVDTVDQAVKESGYKSIEEIQNQNPELAAQIHDKGKSAMMDAAKASISEYIPLEIFFNSIEKRLKGPVLFKRGVEAFITNPAAEIAEEYFSNAIMQASQSRYSMEKKDFEAMGLSDVAKLYFGVLPITGAIAVGAGIADKKQQRLDALMREMDIDLQNRKDAADAAAKAAENAAKLAPQTAAILKNAAITVTDNVTKEAETRAAQPQGKAVTETRTIADSIKDKDTFQYQGMRGALAEENGEVVFREFGTQKKYIVPVATNQALGEIEELEWLRKGQNRQVTGQPIEPVAVPERAAVVETNPDVSQEEFDSEPDEVQVPAALIEIEGSQTLNFLADLFDTGDSVASQNEKAEYKSGKRKGETYNKNVEIPVEELPEYYRQASPEQLDQAKRLIDSALRLIDTMDVDSATKDQLAEHFLLLDQDITNYEQNSEYQKYKQERGWKVSTIGETSEVPTTLTETQAAERELEQRVRAEAESAERRKSVAQATVVAPEVPQGTRIKSAAYVAPDGTIFTANTHLNAMQKAADAGKISQADIAKKQKAVSRETPEFGFSTEAEPFITRDQAENIAKASGQLLVQTPETGRLHTNEVAMDEFNPDIDAPPYIAKAIVNKEPISVEDVDRAGVEMPKGWVVDGDLYVYREATEGGPKPIKRLDAFDRVFAYAQDYVSKNPKSEEVLKNKVGLIIKSLNSRSLFSKFPSFFQDAVLIGIENRLLSALNRGISPEKINAETIVKSAFSDAKKTHKADYEMKSDSLNQERENGRKLDDILSGKDVQGELKLTAQEKKTIEEVRRRTAAVERKLRQKQMAERIITDFEETLTEDEKLAFNFVKAIERLNNDPKNKSKRRQADAARQLLEDNVEDYEEIIRSVVQRFTGLAERVAGQELTPKAPKVKQTASGQSVAAEQKNKRGVLADVDDELAKTENLTEDEQAARTKTEDPAVNTVGAWIKTVKDPKLKKLVNLILKNAPEIANLPIQYVATLNGKYDGFFDPTENNRRIVLPLKTTKDVDLVIAHEIIHGVTLNKARFYDSGQLDMLTAGERRIFGQLDKIRNEMRVMLGKGNEAFTNLMNNPDAAQRAILGAQLVAEGKMGGELYALVNMAEFLANVVDNSEFQKALDVVDPNIFRQIWNLIRGLFYNDKAPSAAEDAIWNSIFELSKTMKVTVGETPAPSFVLPGYGLEGVPILESKSDLYDLVDGAVISKRMSPDDAVKLKAAFNLLPNVAYEGVQVLFTDKLTRNQAKALDMSMLEGFETKGMSNMVESVPVIYINTKKTKRNVARTFIHENAHFIMDQIIDPKDLKKARDIYDSLGISRQSLYTAQYRNGGDTRFAEWFAESMTDYYEKKLEGQGLDISTDAPFVGIYKKIFDLFSGERSKVDELFDGFEATLSRAKNEIARQAEQNIPAPSVALKYDYSNAIKNGDYMQAKLVEENSINKILRVLTPDLLKRDYVEANKTNETYGHCYAASEALYHLLGGKASGLVPMNGKDSNGVVHWWLRSKDSRVIDPTATQYTSIGLNPPYEAGKGGGFLTKEPSRRAQTIIDRVNGLSTGQIAPAAIEPEKRKLSPEEYAIYLEGLSQEALDNTEVSENSRGFGLYEARQIAAKMQPNSPKFKKISDKYFVVDQDWDYIANVDGVPYGLVKEEDPDDENLQVWAYGKVGTFDFNETVYNMGMEEDVIRVMRENLAESQLEGPAPSAIQIPPEEGGTLPPVTNAKLEELGVRASETQIVGTERTYKRILETIARKGMSILDFGSGLGHGLKMLKEEGKRMGFEAIGYEPMWRPDRKAAIQEPDYVGFESLDLIPDNSQDYIINNAVLNVVDQDTRSTIVKEMYNKLKTGGTMFIQARSWTGDVQKLMNNSRNTVIGPREMFVPSKQTFQKGFTSNELVDFVESQLPDANVVSTQFGGVGIAVTKPVGIAPAAVAPKISKVNNEFDESRVGTATQGKVRETTQQTNVSIDTVKPENLKNQMDKLNQFVNGVKLPTFITSIKDPVKKRDAFINFVADNLLALYEAFPVELRAAATRWYDGARKLAEGISKNSGLSVEQSGGIMAAFSPMKDWFQNVEMAIQFSQVYRDHLKTKITKAKFGDALGEITDSSSPKARRGRIRLLAQVEGRTIDGLWKEASRNEAMAKKIQAQRGLGAKAYNALPESKNAKKLRMLASWAVRVVATQQYGLDFNVYSPDGNVLGKKLTKDGTRPKKMVWQSATFIEKALSIAYDGSLKNISDNLGKEHKIRSFYNNIVAPNSPNGDTTIDTHAVNAGVLFPMGNKGRLVSDAFGQAGMAGGGNSGIYWLFHEAYKRAAARAKIVDPATGKVIATGIQPRQMQSITWEAIRGLFPDDVKRKKSFVEQIANIWKNATDARTARTRIVSGELRLPDWAESYARGGASTAGGVASAGRVAGSKADIARGLRNRVRSGDFGIAPSAIDPTVTPDPDSEDNTPNEAAAISRARADAKIGQESIVGHSVLEDEIPPELRQELEASYKNGMTFEDFFNTEKIALDEAYRPYAIAIWLDLNGGLMPNIKPKDREVEKLPSGTAESETVRMLNRAFDIYDSASKAAEEGRQMTYSIADITTTWLRSGLNEAGLRNAIIQFTNLDVTSAITIADDVMKQYELQKKIADSKDRARFRMERALPAITSRQAAEKERMIRLEQAVGTIDAIAEAIKTAYDVNVNKARVDKATEKKQIQEQLRVAKQIIREVVPREYLGSQLLTLERATGLDGLKKVVVAAQDALNKARLNFAVNQARNAFDKAAKSVRAGTLTPEAEVILRGFVDQFSKTGMSETTKAEIEAVMQEYMNDPINALKRLTTTKSGKEVYAIDKYMRRKGQLNAIKIDATLGLDALRAIADLVNSTMHMDKMAKGEMVFNKKMKRDEWKRLIIGEIANVKTITKEEKGFGPKLGGFKWNAIFKGARVENILRGLGLENMRKLIYEDLTLDAYNDELRNRIGLKKKIESAIKDFTGLDVGSKDYDNYSKELFELDGIDSDGNSTTIQVRRSELLDMAASLMDANNFKKAVRSGGYVIDRLRGAKGGDTVKITPQSYMQIQSALNPADIAMVNFLVGLYNNELFSLLNDSSIQAYGHGIKKSNGTYYPRNAFEWDRITETSKDLDYMEYYNSRVDSVGHLKERTDESNARLVAVNYLSRLDYHVTNDSRIAAYLAIVQDINSILKDSDVMRPLETKVGRDVVYQIREMVRQQTVPLPGLRNGVLNTLIGNAGVGILGFKIHSALQNPAGIPIGMGYYGSDGLKYMLKSFTFLAKGFNKNEYLKMAEVLTRYTPYYSERYGEGGFIQEFTSGLAAGPSETRFRKSVEDSSLSWLEMSDKYGALIRYKTAIEIVKDRTDLQQGTPEFDRAVAREWNLMMFRSENTSHGADRTGWFQEAGRNPTFKLFIMFQSAVSKQYSLFAEAVIQAQQGGRENLKEAAMKMAFVATSVYMSLAISSAFYGILFPSDEDEDKELGQVVADTLGLLISAPLSMVPVVGNTMQSMVSGWFSPENMRKPLQIDMLSNFVFGMVDTFDIAAKSIRQLSSDEIDTKTGDPRWWNTSYKAIEKAAGLTGIAFRLPLAGILQTGKFAKRLGESAWDGINGDLPTDEAFQKKLAKVKRELAPESTTQEYAKLYFAVAEGNQNKFNRALRDLREKNPKADRDSVLAAIRRRPEFLIVSMIENGTIKVGEHGVTRDEYLSKKALRSSVEKMATSMWRTSKE